MCKTYTQVEYLTMPSTMLKVALDSKSAKIDKKLKMVDLQVAKQKLDPRHRSDSSNQ